MEVCRICLATDRKMYTLDRNHKELYENVTGLTFMSDTEYPLPEYVCWECRHNLSKYVAFKSKAVTSQSILTEIAKRDGLITKTEIQSVNCNKSTLSCTEVLYLYIKEEDDDDSLDLETKIKNEPNNSNINNVIDKKYDLINDLIDDSQVCSDDSLANKFIMASDYKPSENEVEDSEDNKNITKKIPVKLSCVKRKRKQKVSEDYKNVIKEHTEYKKVKLVCTKRIKEIDNNVMKLSELTIDEQIAEIQSRKETDNYKISPYKCENCFKGFLDDDTLERHMIKHSETSGARECPLCKMRYKKQSFLNRHMKSHMFKYSCQQCIFSTSSIEVALKHQNYHGGKQYNCPHCFEIYTHRTTYMTHLRLKHPSDAICQRCGSSFVNDRGLKLHVKWVHRFDQKPIPADGPLCVRCDIRFACQDALDNHKYLSAKHADERTEYVGLDARRKRKLAELKIQRIKRPRSKSAWTSEPYPDGARQCEQCDEKLTNPRAYFFHFRNMHKDKNRTVFYNKTYQRQMCEICGQLLQSASLLRSHQYAHSDTKEFKCDRCGKLFQLELHLRNHQKYHCGTRLEFPCSVCGKKFSSRSNLGRHMAVHKGYVYKCEMCDKVFNSQGNKKNHVDFVHKKKPWPKRNRGARRRPEKQPEGLLQNPSYETDIQEEWTSP